MSVELDALGTQVAANTSVEESAVVLINGLSAQIKAAGTNPVALAALTANLDNYARKLAKAVVGEYTS